MIERGADRDRNSERKMSRWAERETEPVLNSDTEMGRRAEINRTTA